MVPDRGPKCNSNYLKHLMMAFSKCPVFISFLFDVYCCVDSVIRFYMHRWLPTERKSKSDKMEPAV